MTQSIVTGLIRPTCFDPVTKAYQDALARGDPLPTEAEVMSTEDLTFHAP